MPEPDNNRLLILATVAVAMATITLIPDKEFPEGIKFDEMIHLILNAQTVHHNNPEFPVVVPDMCYAGTRMNRTSIQDFNLVSDNKERRRRYHKGMNAQQEKRRNTWKIIVNISCQEPSIKTS